MSKYDPIPSRVDHATYRLWVNDESTVLVRLWSSGVIEAATRSEPGVTWGPPTRLREEQT